MNKNIHIFILLALLCPACGLALADQPSSSLDDKPSVDSAASAQVQIPPVASDAAAADNHTSYLYDLKKLIEKSRTNIKEVNEKIKEQAVLKRNQKREERAHEYYEKGVELTNEGKLDEAREYFEKAIRITEHPEMVGYIKESQRRLRKQEDALHHQEKERFEQIKQDENTRKEDVETAYKEAVDLYKQKKYHPAKDAFEHVDEIAPDYRATASYLKIIDQDIITADAIAAKQQAVEIEHQQNEAEAARAKEKQMWLAQIEEKEKERKESIDRQAQEVYDQAIALYNKKQYAEAKKKFEEVSWVIPDYKATMKYLQRIDRDADKEKERIAEEQKKALQQQRWEETVAAKKLEAQRQHELEVKERQHKQDLLEQAQFMYIEAVALFDKKDFEGALGKFNDIEKLTPDYKSTRDYIIRLEKMDFYQKERLTLPAPTVQEVQAVPVMDERQKELADEHRRAQELKDRTDQAQQIYSLAVQSYRHHQWETARAQFRSVEQLIADFKHTRRYLLKVEDQISRETKAAPTVVVPSAPVVVAAVHEIPVPVVAPLQSPMPAQVKVAVSLQDQQKQAQDIAALAEKSAQLYRQIADIADDNSTVQTKRKMAQVDEILRNLKESKERLLRQMQEEQWKRQEEETKAKQQEHRAEAQKLYEDGLDSLRSHDYAKAKIKFLQLENIIPDYKSTRRYLSQINNDQKQANVEAVTSYEKNEAARLKQLQDKEDADQLLKTRQEQQKEQTVQEQQQASLKDLAQKASNINDDIIRLSKAQDYDGMKAKFAELENTVTALTTLKDEMAKEKDRQDRDKQLARESIQRRNELLRAQKREDQQIRSYYNVQPLKEYRPILSNQVADVDHYKRREIMQEQNMLFSEGVDRYEHKQYSQAKLLFGELADQQDHRAEVWLKKVDRAITRELLRSQEGEERERTAFLADQLKAQRELIIIQERERQRQKKLTEELEHQKLLYEDNMSLQIRKEQTMKAQARERELQEAKRRQLEKEREKQEDMLRFHKIVPPKQAVAVAPPVVPAPVVAAPVPAAVVPVPAAVPPAAVVPPALTAKQLQAQIEFSNQRKAFLDAKYEKEQKEKARQKRIEERQAQLKAVADARQKRIEERQKEREHQRELKAQREAERQAKLKAEAEAKAAEAKAEAQKAAQEEKQKEEMLRQQEQEREEKAKQDQIIREEQQRREELERQERQRQAQLEAQRQAVRKELEDGVEAMYQEALSLYKQGEYTAAADRFKDVQDILPGYKRSGQYMDEAREKSLEVKPQDNVSKALDLFDPNAK